jgi:hypothetical protein
VRSVVEFAAISPHGGSRALIHALVLHLPTSAAPLVLEPGVCCIGVARHFSIATSRMAIGKARKVMVPSRILRTICIQSFRFCACALANCDTHYPVLDPLNAFSSKNKGSKTDAPSSPPRVSSRNVTLASRLQKVALQTRQSGNHTFHI